MKRVIIIIVICLLSINCFSQINIGIDSVFVKNIIDTVPRITKASDSSICFEYIEGMGAGPEIKLYCSFVNDSTSPITLSKFLFGTFITFKYKGVTYKAYIFPDTKQSIVTILPKQKFSLCLSSEYLLLIEDIMNDREEIFSGIYRYDFTNVVMETLPTIRVHYVDEKISITSDYIKLKRIIMN